ncbi:DUF4097 family beta strand repeat-containing protein [Mycobacterium sp. NPDC003449]
MTTFQTPEPISAVIEVVAGAVRLIASERDDTVVEVRPRDPHRASDVRAAEQARVEYHGGALTVSAGRRVLSLGRGGAVGIDIALPVNSRLKASSASADVDADGTYSECRFASASGHVRIGAVAGNIKADTASGDVTVDEVVGNVTISTASGDVAIGRLEGDAKFQAASGSVAVTSAVTGALSAQTASGDIEVGIPEGTAAHLELATRSGTVTNGLQATDGPAGADDTVMVHVRTGSGDIAVRRATGPAAARALSPAPAPTAAKSN